MADKRLMVEIVAKDGVSRIFQEIGRNAQAMTRALETSANGAADGIERVDDAALSAERAVTDFGRAERTAADASERVEQSAGRAATALKQVDRAAADSGRSFRDFGDAGEQMGQGLAILGASFTMFANAAADETRQISALELIYGNAAAGALAYADSLQDLTVYSDDAARAALQMTGSLTGAYGVSAEQAQQLVSVSADLAAVTGRDLADATERVAAGIRGEAESLEALGINLSESAVAAYAAANGLGNFNAMTDGAQKAQIRYAYLLEQTARFEGEAARQAQTRTGDIRQLANAVQDAGQDFAAWTGPLGEVAAGLGSFGLEAGLAAGGAVRLAQGARTAITAMGGFGALLGPAGIALALGGAAYAAYEFASSLGDDLDVKLKQTQDSAADLDLTIASLTGTMNDAAMALTISQGDALLDEQRKQAEYYAWLVDTYADLPTDRLYLDTSNMDEATKASIEQHRQALAYIEQYAAMYGDAETALESVTAAQDDYNTILRHHGPGAELALQATADLIDQLQRGEITYADFAVRLDEVANNLGTYDQQALQAAATTERLTEAVNSLTVANYDLLESQRAGVTILTEEEAAENARREALLKARNTALMLGDKLVENLKAQQQAAQAAAEATAAALGTAFAEKMADEARQAREELEAFSSYVSTEWVPALEAGMERASVSTERLDRALDFTGERAVLAGYHFREFGAMLTQTAEEVGLIDDAVERLRAGGVATPSINLAIDTGNANQVLDQTFGAVVGQTESWGQLSQSVADWSASLAHGYLAQTRLDNALLDGLITRSTYQKALEANHEIQQANESVQEDLLRIQIKQMPVIASLTQQQAAYVDSLADADTQTQLVALGYMDAAQSARVMEISQLAAAASTDAQRDATSEMITEMVNADPVLKAMLLDMGLISEGANGTITVNFGEAVDADAAINGLNDTLEDLITLLGNIFNIDTDTDAPETQVAVQDLIGTINGVPKDVTTYFNAVDNVSWKAQEIREIMALIDGTTATTYINTVQTGGGLSLNNPFAATGITITPDIPLTTLQPLPSYAGGGTHAIVGEYGRELVWLPNGAQVTPAGASESRMQAMEHGNRGRSGGVNFYGPVTLAPASTDVESAIRQDALARGRR
jgi:hypothetical protein